MATKKKTPGKSPEQRKAEALHDQLAQQVEALAESEQWRNFLTFAASFYSYSVNNLLLIMAQHPSAVAVAGFRQWQAKDRQVRKGEKAIKIIGYSTKKVTDEDENGDEITKRIARFPILPVFALDQTDPIEGTEDHSTVTHQLDGEDPAGIYDRVRDYLIGIGWSVEREHITGANGYTTTDGSRRVVVAAGLSPAQAAKTALHEAAHVTLHSQMTGAEYVQHRGTVETEAESIAYVMAAMLGIDTSGYSVGYVATWSKANPDLIRATAADVLDAVQTLAAALIEDGQAAPKSK